MREDRRKKCPALHVMCLSQGFCARASKVVEYAPLIVWNHVQMGACTCVNYARAPDCANFGR